MSIDQILRNELTPQQYDAAVDTTQEVLSLACAGSGKSRTLAYLWLAKIESVSVSKYFLVADHCSSDLWSYNIEDVTVPWARFNMVVGNAMVKSGNIPV